MSKLSHSMCLLFCRPTPLLHLPVTNVSFTACKLIYFMLLNSQSSFIDQLITSVLSCSRLHQGQHPASLVYLQKPNNFTCTDFNEFLNDNVTSRFWWYFPLTGTAMIDHIYQEQYRFTLLYNQQECSKTVSNNMLHHPELTTDHVDNKCSHANIYKPSSYWNGMLIN